MIELTPSAKEYMEKLVKDNKSRYILLSVKGGGCSGFTYDWSLSDMRGFGPTIDNILCIDDMAEMFVAGCTVDYVSELGGSYLKVINPNATASCGCGESFAV
ncbi:MAG: iron-sulfur cluster assembly accessory protein [Verrucomicrobiales bacterium]|jgi:iron-sulfur cluster assembly accessory protein|nr:iron-sulfur cluster assembly accessory protein [Verrucomicrobiales bacterium]|tara:strand:+ start:24571 stop:24876 length:306 start_codon:yes stop_codon:yes gene_type:complete